MTDEQQTSVTLGKKGSILDARQQGKLVRREHWMNLGLVVGTGVLVFSFFQHLPIAMGATVLTAAWIGFSERWRSKTAAVQRRLEEGRIDEALEDGEKLLSRRWFPRGYVPRMNYLLSKGHWRRGEFTEALEKNLKASGLLEGSRGAEKELLFWVLYFDRLQLFLLSGQNDKFKEDYQVMGEAPDGAFFQNQRLFTKILATLKTGNKKYFPPAAKLPGEGGEGDPAFPIALAWAFEKHGQSKKSQKLLQVVGKDGIESIEKTVPPLYRWAVSKS